MGTSIRDVMTVDPVTMSAGATIGDAARAMREQAVGDVIVVDEYGAPCGVVTDRDIVVRAVAEDAMPTEALIGDVCSHDVATVEITASAKDAEKLMRARAVRRLPVVQGDRVVGVVSLGDLAIERDPDSPLADITGAPADT